MSIEQIIQHVIDRVDGEVEIYQSVYEERTGWAGCELDDTLDECEWCGGPEASRITVEGPFGDAERILCEGCWAEGW